MHLLSRNINSFNSIYSSLILLIADSRFTGIGIDTLEDAIDVDLVSDEILKKDIGFTDGQLAQFRM